MSDTDRDEAMKCDNTLWLNARGCVHPTDEFAIQVGREVIQMLMNGTPKSEPIEPFRRTTIEVACS